MPPFGSEVPEVLQNNFQRAPGNSEVMEAVRNGFNALANGISDDGDHGTGIEAL